MSTDPGRRTTIDDLIVICDDGCPSSLAAARLDRLGFGWVADLIGGYWACAAAGLLTRDA